MNASIRLTLLGLAAALAAAGTADAYMVRQTGQVESLHCTTIAYQCDRCTYYWSPATGFTPAHVCERTGEWYEGHFCVLEAGPWCVWFDDPPAPPLP